MFTLIICTYMRPKPLLSLLQSVNEQSLYPTEILIIDGSTSEDTEQVLSENSFKNLKYYRVDASNRGLTRQRNYGIQLVSESSDIVCFLDDDIVLTASYFERLIETYSVHDDALAVGGYIANEVDWEPETTPKSALKFYFDSWMRNEPSRFRLRHKFGLGPDTDPGYLPTFAHGRSTGFLPPSGKTYPVEQLMGGVSSFKKDIFKTMSFSTYFEGYGLYEDADFTIRLAKQGPLYLNTNAQLFHYHDDSGRPNQYNYGKMVLRNGWYVWRVKYDNPSLKARFKWHATALLLTLIRFSNILTSSSKKEALTESLGRVVGWFSLFFNSPKIER